MSLPSAIRDEATGVIYRRWVVQAPDAVFLLVHGLGAHSGRWERLARYFLQHSISSYALDLRGFGETPHPKGHVDSFRSYFKDIQALCDIIKRESGGKPVFLVGESMGGLIAFSLALSQPGTFSGLVCLSPAFKSKLKLRWGKRLQAFLFCLVGVKKSVKLSFTCAMCTRDSECVKEIEQDPHEHRHATPQLLLQIVLAGWRARFLPSALDIPVLFLVSGDHDMLIDPAGTKKVYALLQARDKKFIEYQEMFHSLSMDLGREQVFEDILQWMRARIKGGRK